MDRRDANDEVSGVEVEIHLQAHTAIVTLRGEHGIDTQARVSDALTVASDQPKVLVDLSECTFADSSLINALIDANTRIAQRGGQLEVVIPPSAGATRQLAELTRLEPIMPVHTSRAGVPHAGHGVT